MKYTCCPHPYSEVLVTLNLERRSRYYVINLVFPCALIACMVFFTFVLPPECGERVSLCITILMAMTIFQELTSSKLPPSSDTFFLIGEYRLPLSTARRLMNIIINNNFNLRGWANRSHQVNCVLASTALKQRS